MYDYFGARYYDSQLGIWYQVDPLTEKYPGWSPFNYSMNDPINMFDPNGKEVIISKALWNYNSNGFNFQEYAVRSKEFRTALALFGKGGPLEHIKIKFNLAKEGSLYIGQTYFYLNGTKLTHYNTFPKLRQLLPKGKIDALTEISLNPASDHFHEDKTTDHELSHAAYQAAQLLLNEMTLENVIMLIGAEQDSRLFQNSNPTYGMTGIMDMTSNEKLRAVLKAYLDQGKEDDIKTAKDVEEKSTIE